MATQTVAAPSVPLQFPQSIPAKEVISQEELGLILSLKAQLARIQAQVNTAEESLKTRLQTGARVQPGDHHVELKESFRKNVSWKTVCIRLALRLKLDGQQYCSRVLASTKPTRTVSLIVE